MQGLLAERIKEVPAQRASIQHELCADLQLPFMQQIEF
jgi:hypothetical protein